MTNAYFPPFDYLPSMAGAASLPLDEIAAAAYEAAYFDRVKAAQVNGLLEALESLGDVDLLLGFLARQVARRAWGRGVSASRLYDVLRGRSVGEARRILGVFRWLFEVASNRRIRTRPSRPAQSGYYAIFLKEALGR